MVMSGAGVAQVQLQGPGVAGLPEALDGPGRTKKVRVDPFPQPGVGGRGADDLPAPFAAHRKGPQTGGVQHPLS